MGNEIIILYKKKVRNVTPLARACAELKFDLQVVETDLEFRTVMSRGGVAVIIINLDAGKAGTGSADDFTSNAANIFEPEDADIYLIYSCEGETDTPRNWPLDPRPIRNYQADNLLDFFTKDIGWKGTISKLENISRYQDINVNTGAIIINSQIESSKVPFPTEVNFLLRAAFKDMASVVVRFPDQGLSGSIACYVRPQDKHGNFSNERFVKMYPDAMMALQDLQNSSKYFDPYISKAYHPTYDMFRRYHGRIYSVLVTDVEARPDGITTLKDLIDSKEISVEIIADFIKHVLIIMNHGNLSALDGGWKCIKCVAPRNLYDDYLGLFLSRTNKKKNVWSQNNCNKWFGTIADIPEPKNIDHSIKSMLSGFNITGTYSKICHGDLHSENVVVRKEGDKLFPLFIDFSRTGQTHSLKDLVTLEADMIIRGLSHIRSLTDPGVVRDFLHVLTFPISEINYKKEWVTEEVEETRLKKVLVVLQALRMDAVEFHKVSQREYECAALLKTLEILSYGKLPHDQNVRATSYVSYLLEKLRRPENS